MGSSQVARNVAGRMAEAAAAWLASLDDVQRGQGTWPWEPEGERERWFYTPTDHGGLALRDMRPGQQSLAMQFVATGLSRAGYTTVSTIMGLENVLDQVEGWQVGWGRERGRDPQLYWLRVFGEPADQGAWSWRFGGHHVSLNILVFDGEVQAATPSFLGADPAESPLLGLHALRPLGAAEDVARDLVQSLDGPQAERAILTGAAPVDIVSGNRARVSDGDQVMALPDLWRARFAEPDLAERVEAMHAGAEQKAGLQPRDHDAVRITSRPKGIAADDLTRAQQEMVRSLLDVYLGRLPDELAECEADKYAGDRLGKVHFAWAGGTARHQPHYYRLQGPRILVEYDNTQRDVNHIHAVWRDPQGDFGHDALRQHLREAHR